MRIRSLLALSALLTALAVTEPAQAQTYAYAAGGGYTNMRAGPSTRYPVVARIHPGSRVYVLGCIYDHSWCEGVVQGVQGWIHAQRLEFLYAGRRVLVPSYYSYFGAPIISFSFNDYYDDWRPRHRRPHWRPPHDNYTPPNDGGYTNWKPPSVYGGGGGQVIDAAAASSARDLAFPTADPVECLAVVARASSRLRAVSTAAEASVAAAEAAAARSASRPAELTA